VPFKTQKETAEEAQARAKGNPSEFSFAEAFECQYEGEWMHDHLRGKWLKFNEVGIWQEDETEESRHLMREHVDRLSQGVPKWRAAKVVSGVERLVRARPGIATLRTALDADPFLLGTPRGVYDLEAGELLPHDPAHLVTKCTAVAPEKGPAPRWEQFLREATGNAKDFMDFLQRLAGYCLTGDTREESLHFFWGPGGNGKGVFLGALSDVMGPYARTASMATFLQSKQPQHTSDLADLYGARLVIGSESSEGARWDEQRMKAVSGRDFLTVRHLYGQFFTYKPTFKVALAANHKPRIPAVDEGWRRRMHLIPFDKKPANPDHELKDKLREEYPQILQWMIEGCELWLAEGLAPPGVVLDASKAYLEEEDTLGLWIKERCIKGGTAKPAELFADYATWCEGMDHGAGTQHKLTRYLKNHGYEQSLTLAGRPFTGLRLPTSEELDARRKGTPRDWGWE